MSRRLTSASFHGTFTDIPADRADDGWLRPLQAANGTFPLNLPLIFANVAGLDCEGIDEGAALVLYTTEVDSECKTKPAVRQFNLPRDKRHLW